jgi:hypothetical protein
LRRYSFINEAVPSVRQVSGYHKIHGCVQRRQKPPGYEALLPPLRLCIYTCRVLFLTFP